MITHLTLL